MSMSSATEPARHPAVAPAGELPARNVGQMSSNSARRDNGPVTVRELGLIDYQQAWDLQHDLAARRAAGEIPDHLLLLEHPSVYTAGKRTQPSDLPVDDSPVISVDRGGRITWHGPGQLVGYPIVRLAEPLDVVDYVRRLEQALIQVCSDLGVTCGRVAGRSGVWVAAADGIQRKIAAIGVRVQRAVAMHGVALNCNADLSRFRAIVPCGLPDVGTTSLTRELGTEITVAQVRDRLAEAILAALDGDLPVTVHDLAESTSQKAGNLS